MKKKMIKEIKPLKSNDVPVTVGLLKDVQSGLASQIQSLDRRIDSLDKKMEASFHNLRALIEEQNARNIFVLDGLSSLFSRQERIETQLNSFIANK